MANVIFRYGAKSLYDALQQKDANTLYWLTDTQELYKGEVLFGTGAVATQTAPGLMSAVDKVKLDSLAAGTVAGLTAVDASVVLADGEDGTKTIGVKLSAEEGNALALKADGLFVPAGGVDTSNFVLETIEATNGKAIIQNEPTGGGPKFHHTDGSQAYVGVNDGGLTGMMAQIYADKYDEENSRWVGSRINVYHDHIYYTSLADKEAGKANNAAECEIATKGDLAAIESTVSESLTWGAL